MARRILTRKGHLRHAVPVVAPDYLERFHSHRQFRARPSQPAGDSAIWSTRSVGVVLACHRLESLAERRARHSGHA